MNRFNKAQLKQFEELQMKLRKSFDELEEEVVNCNSTILAAWEKVEASRGAYNEIVAEVETFREEIHSAMEDFSSDKTDRWTESDRGQAYHAWMEEWGESWDELELEQPAEVSLEPDRSVEDFEGLATELDA